LIKKTFYSPVATTLDCKIKGEVFNEMQLGDQKISLLLRIAVASRVLDKILSIKDLATLAVEGTKHEGATHFHQFGIVTVCNMLPFFEKSRLDLPPASRQVPASAPPG
jgi:hypothetical protein